ncbi:MAG TPA: hypothetical protein VFQ36_04315, partial [Ktedonobacteraceae bacterium]|nr:hypothetical protein [Ktedonobacteraceae bacterium]
MTTNLDTTYKVSKGNVPPNISSQDYDEDPTHHGERNYFEAIELATIWMREGNKFVVVWDSGIGQTVTASEHGVHLSNTS